MDRKLYAGNKLLDAWLSLTSTLWNTRLVTSMTYNEAHVLGLLLHHQDRPMTATDLIARTHLLKSQMNRLLTSLEARGHITRERAQEDRRRIEIRLTPQGEAAYREEHRGIDAILTRLLDRIGEERALHIAGEINTVIAALDDILPSAQADAQTTDERKDAI